MITSFIGGGGHPCSEIARRHVRCWRLFIGHPGQLVELTGIDGLSPPCPGIGAGNKKRSLNEAKD